METYGSQICNEKKKNVPDFEELFLSVVDGRESQIQSEMLGVLTFLS